MNHKKAPPAGLEPEAIPNAPFWPKAVIQTFRL